jgi:hypothetical protein
MPGQHDDVMRCFAEACQRGDMPWPGFRRGAHERRPPPPYRILSQLGMVSVKAGPHPGRRRGKAGRYLKSDPPKLYRFELLNDGFDEPAIPVTRQVVARLRQQAAAPGPR